MVSFDSEIEVRRPSNRTLSILFSYYSFKIKKSYHANAIYLNFINYKWTSIVIIQSTANPDNNF